MPGTRKNIPDVHCADADLKMCASLGHSLVAEKSFRAMGAVEMSF